MRIGRAIVLATLIMAIDPAGAAIAQSWPHRPIKLIVPTGPGAATDVMARLMAEDVGRRIGGSMIVENRAGASGIPAHQAAATADPDGYTFLFTNTSGLASNLVTFKKLPYDPTADFQAVAMVVNLAPQLISVNSALPVKSLGELIEYAKANPGKVSYGADATAGAAVFAGRLFNKRSGAGIAEVAYRSAAQMIQDGASGVLPMIVSSIAVAAPFHQTGQLRPVAVTSSMRFPSMPDVQAINETLKGVQMDGWFALVAPKGIAPAIVEKVNAAVGEYLKLPDTQKRLIDIGLATSGAGTPASTAAFIRTQQEAWRVLASELDIQAQ